MGASYSLWMKLTTILSRSFSTKTCKSIENWLSVDVRDIVEGKTIPHADVLDRYVVPVDRIEVLKDQDFFIKAIERCEERASARIKVIEEGLGTEKKVHQDKDEWKELQESKNSEYLRRTVYPILYPVRKKFMPIGSSDHRSWTTPRSANFYSSVHA